MHELMVRESGMSEDIEVCSSAEDGLVYLISNLNSRRELLVFLDINMPAMSGWDFLETLEKLDHNENVHVVMVTSSVNNSDRKKSDRYRHVVGFIEKPLSIETCKTVMSRKELKQVFFSGAN